MKHALLALLCSLSALAENPLAIPAEGTTGKPVDFSYEEIRTIAEKHLSEDAKKPKPNETLEELAKRLATPEAAFDFVRDKIALQSYPGSLRGPDLCLAAAAGNPMDRAALLGEILWLQGHAIQFSHGPLSDENIERAISRIVSESVFPPKAEGPFFSAIIARAHAAFAPLRAAGAKIATESIKPAELHTAAFDDLRDHWWVELGRDGGFIPMDPLFRDSTSGTKQADTEETLETIPDDRPQTISLKIIAEISQGGKILQETGLEHETTVEEFSTSIVTLGRCDTGYGDGLAKKLGSIIGVDTYQPALQIGRQTFKGTSIQLGSTEGKTSGGPLAELSFGDEENSGDAGKRELVGLVLEIRCHAPRHEPLLSCRILYDRIPAAERLAWETAGRPENGTITPSPENPGELASALGTFHLIHAYHGAHNPGAWAATNRGIVEGVLAQEEGGALDGDAIRNLLASNWRALPMLSDLFITPALNDLPGLRLYPAFPRIAIVSIESSDGISVSVDLLQDELRAVASEAISPKDLALRQLWKGALEGALEHEMTGLFTASFRKEFKTLDRSATHLTDLRIATAGDAENGGIALRTSLAAGNLVLIDPAEPDGSSFWEIKAATGSTKAISEPGLGASKVRFARPGTLNGANVWEVDTKTFKSRRVVDVKRVKPPAKNPGPVGEYLEVLETMIMNSLPAAAAFYTVTGTCMVVSEVALFDLWQGRDPVDRYR